MNSLQPLNPLPLVAQPALDPSVDYYQLRRQGIGHVQQAGSQQWTDYNIHDPGITILEALCYAITDVGYRVEWNIEDILAPAVPAADPARPYPDQTFYTAREVLTVNPPTIADFRRLLIDLPGVSDAWVLCKSCACEVSYWAYCDLTGNLLLQYGQPASPPNPASETWVLGLYESLLELDDDPELGDLNDRLVEQNSVYHDSDGAHPILMELRFPDIALLERDAWQRFLTDDASFADTEAFSIELTRLGATRTYNVFDLPDPADRHAYLRQQWGGVFYVSLSISFSGSPAVIDIQNAALRVFADDAVRNTVGAEAWRTRFTDATSAGFVLRYRKKAKAAAAAVAGAKAALQQQRNLGEDYCLIDCAGAEQVAVCADIEVRPDADIERVQAGIWFALEQYMTPPVPFRTLQELQGRDVAVEDIFNGPALANGFIEDADLAAAQLKTMLHTSDMIHLLMDIDGVLAVNQLRMTKYDDEGLVVAGAADPVWINDQPIYDPARTSAAWLLAISPRHQPRLYLNQSRFLFYKDGLPFLPRMDEATDTLNQLRGDADRPKDPGAPNDLPVPAGVYRQPEDYFPVQNSFPLTYGIGPDGLPPRALPARKAQARNLKAYLLVFEQLLGNALAQLAHSSDLFSLDASITRTYFVKQLDASTIKDLTDIADPIKLTRAAVEALVETPAGFQTRRNAFLDHLLARFGEQFNEYTLLLTQATGDVVAKEQLIASKIAFLRRYPAVSHDRARAFNYQIEPNAPGNEPGIKQRINLLLGYPDLSYQWTAGAPVAGVYLVDYQLVDGLGTAQLEGTLSVTAGSVGNAGEGAYRVLLDRMILDEAYTVAPVAGGKFGLVLDEVSSAEIGRSPATFATAAEALALKAMLLSWSAGARILVIEHILLRPKFIGDALYPACCEDSCSTCGSADPYSFRLTYVMPGWTAQYTDNLDLRRYANRTIERETPSHLLAKTCWVGNDGYVENPCDQVVEDLADLLQADGLTAASMPPSSDDACADAHAILHVFSEAFSPWFESKKLSFLHDDAWATAVTALFADIPVPVAGAYTTLFLPPLWDGVCALMSARFTEVASQGWQFERFEAAWRTWLDANAVIDWTDERLIERVEALLAAGLLLTSNVAAASLCECARRIVTDYGSTYYAWMRDNITAGHAFDALTPFVEPAVTLCTGLSFTPVTQKRIATLLQERYAAYALPSYWLWMVTSLLAGLRNTYPGATLHDCDEGSDFNPVRLDNTALGNYPRKTTL
ncbi:hypothetical protein PY254_10925 [Rhodanobacter sp. AS-Z3]|uniref:hypothetical protein n=1 Tax=Rhodanobacter sp. AS-Z3 TaxID=3031330 RepID=UPI00247ABC30|nr:hypothetical protein [Rhodanobacter sp. AS-Z3]WEN13757.1 hypothetical protein PY254_10925 [Rhodanobacter sp. AS-Z3]